MTVNYTHQHESLDDMLYRHHRNSHNLAAIMELNPHALHAPRLAAGIRIHMPAICATPAPTLKLWE